MAASTSAPERKELAALSSDTGGFVGFLTYDLGMAEAASQCYQQAAEAALEAATSPPGPTSADR
ncbi:hypothetical protein ACIOG4_28080 [Streptomyces microflavus]|uniref:hypothetical protein n=1 Tax=Streptomyces microflavus TaxID=1919 RepID=UPI0038005F36